MTTPLIQLSAAAIRALSDAIRGGRISPPFSAISLRDYAPGADSLEIARELERLANGGMESAHIAYMLDAIAAERTKNQSIEELVELVWTGPESIQSATRDTGVVVREMFASAREELLIAGYAVYRGKRVFKELAERMDAMPGLRARMFLNITRTYQDQRTDAELLHNFAHLFHENDWPGTRSPEIFYDPRGLNSDTGTHTSLHAKCVVVDYTDALITSANFTEAAQQRNIEVGILVRVPSLAKSLVEQFENLISNGQLRRVPGI